MKHSIKEQIGAVNKMRTALKKNGSRLAAEIFPSPNKAGEFDEKLNDAASTLSALNFIGQDKVLIAPELIQEVKEMLDAWHAGTLQDVSFRLNKLENILNRLPK